MARRNGRSARSARRTSRSTFRSRGTGYRAGGRRVRARSTVRRSSRGGYRGTSRRGQQTIRLVIEQPQAAAPVARPELLGLKPATPPRKAAL